MESVVNRLYEIEACAQNIMEDVVARKKEMSLAMEQKTDAFKHQVDEDTQTALEKVRTDLNMKMEKDLERMKSFTEKAITHMDHEYETKHSEFALWVLKQITEQGGNEK